MPLIWRDRRGTGTLAPSPWHKAMGMEPSDVLVQECEEINGELIVKATRIERDGVVIKRRVEGASTDVEMRSAIVNQDLDFQCVLALEIERGTERMPDPEPPAASPR